tara:strand:+ start:630 stop:1211 length:582 start_codon:yes stop_codon:yes gene_type:complete
MKAALWGPGAWHALVVSAYAASTAEELQAVQSLCDAMGKVLPCPHCRSNYPRHRRRARRNFPALRSNLEAVSYVHTIKDGVNRDLSQRSIPVCDLVMRLTLSKNRCDDVAVVDMLLYFAYGIQEEGEAVHEQFVDLCHALASTLPLPADSALRELLPQASRPIIRYALDLNRHTREEHGLRGVSGAQVRSAAK